MKAIKVWVIIGIILTPIIYGASIFNHGQNPYGLFGLLLYVVTIPLGIYILLSLKKAHSRKEMIGKGVICIIFVSVIGGILILTSNDGIYSSDKKADNNQNIQKKETIDSSTQENLFVEFNKDKKEAFEKYLVTELDICNAEDLKVKLSSFSQIDSEYILGLCNFYGIYIEHDYNAALDHFLICSDLGGGEGSYSAATIYRLDLNGDHYNNSDLYRLYLNIAAHQNLERAKLEWDTNFKDYVYYSKYEKSKLYRSVLKLFKINDDLELLDLVHSFVSSLKLFIPDVESKRKNFLNMLSETYEANMNDSQKLYNERDERKCKILSIKMVQNYIFGNNASFKENKNLWIKYFGNNSLLDSLDSNDNNATLLARHIAIVYLLCKKRQPSAQLMDLFFVIAVINLHPYFENRQLTMTELGRQFNNFLEKNIKTSDGKVYPIPDESNDEKALITSISVYCLYLALKFDNPSLSEKDNVEFLFSNYYRMKKVVSNILNGQFTKADIEFSKTTEPIVNSKTMTDALKGIK